MAAAATGTPVSAADAPREQPPPGPIITVDELKAGQTGEVWTVFSGTRPEPFSVEVTGVIRNALGPGKSIILCRLTDPRVQDMGAVAGMSGSPLYVDGRFAGALSYQVQRFETVRYAGFTPAADMAEVGDRSERPPDAAVASDTEPAEAPSGLPFASARQLPSGLPFQSAPDSPYRALRPSFTLGGLSPSVVQLMAPQFASLGLDVNALGGSSQGSAGETNGVHSPGASRSTASMGDSASTGDGSPSAPASAPPRPSLRPGDAVSVALATGDITLAGTGTVSRVDGDKVVAFGHPMLGMGDVQLPMCSADIVTILPSTLESMKVANVGPIIGRIVQDRLSAVSGTLGEGPAMIDVDVAVARPGAEDRRLHFQVARQQQITPILVASGVSESILGSNDSGLSNGFRITSDVTFSPTEKLNAATLYAGPQAFMLGLGEFVQSLAADLQNPYEKTFPSRVSFRVEPLEENPAVTVDAFQLSRANIRADDPLHITLAWHDYQGADHHETIDVPIQAQWVGKSLEVILAPGRVLDELTGHPHAVPPGQLRSFSAYLEAIRQSRATDGLCIAVVERSSLFSDQALSTPDAPGSIERIARGSDDIRFQKRDALLPLWETHVLPGKVAPVILRRALQVLP